MKFPINCPSKTGIVENSIKGIVSFSNCFHLPAPSIFAASYKETSLLERFPVASNMMDGTLIQQFTKSPISLALHFASKSRNPMALFPQAAISWINRPSRMLFLLHSLYPVIMPDQVRQNNSMLLRWYNIPAIICKCDQDHKYNRQNVKYTYPQYRQCQHKYVKFLIKELSDFLPESQPVFPLFHTFLHGTYIFQI